jgi:hypothetical protein
MRNRVLIYAEALDVAAEGAVWYARQIAGDAFRALHVPGPRSDTGIHARWFDYTGGEPRLEVRPAGTDPTAAVLEEVERLRAEGDDVVVTVVLPEQFRRRSLVAAAQRSQFRLKLRLLVEPRVVVADVPAVTSEHRPEGRVPDRLVIRVLAGGLDEAARAADYARSLGVEDVRAFHVGEREWDADELGLPVDSAPAAGRLGDSVLAYVRGLTEDEGAAVNIILPERIRENMRFLRSRRALAIKRLLLFEPHVILSSIPYRA